MDEAPAVVVVGAACRDLVDDDERGWRLGGGASYSALALARLGLRVGALVVADELASTSRELNTIRDAGVDVRVIPGSRGPIFINVETPNGPHPADAADLRRRGPAGAPGGLAGRQGLDVRAGGRGGRATSGRTCRARTPSSRLGWQGLLRVLRDGAPVHHLPPGPSPVVRRANLSGSAATTWTMRPRRRISPSSCIPGPRCCSRTASTAARPTGWGSVRTTSSARHWHSIPIEKYVDPVGAGDTFLAAVFAAWVDPADHDRMGRPGPGPAPRRRVRLADPRGPGRLRCPVPGGRRPPHARRGQPRLTAALPQASVRGTPRRIRAARRAPRRCRSASTRGYGRPVARERSSSRQAARVAARAPDGIPEAVLAQLRHLDPGDRARGRRRPPRPSAMPRRPPPSGRAVAAPGPAPPPGARPSSGDRLPGRRPPATGPSGPPRPLARSPRQPARGGARRSAAASAATTTRPAPSSTASRAAAGATGESARTGPGPARRPRARRPGTPAPRRGGGPVRRRGPARRGPRGARRGARRAPRTGAPRGRAAARASARPSRCGSRRPPARPRARPAARRGRSAGSPSPPRPRRARRPAARPSTVRSRASSMRCRNTRRTNGSRSRWPACAGAARPASRNRASISGQSNPRPL